MNVAVLVSGLGSNLQSLMDQEEKGLLGAAHIKLVVSDDPLALALERARAKNVPVAVLERKTYLDHERFEQDMVRVLKKNNIDLVVLAGFMRILKKTMLGAFAGRIINIHPSLLPAFPGIDAQKQALDYGVRVSGCTVHFVDEGMDSGPIIAQIPVPVNPEDTKGDLSARILGYEHQLLPIVVRLISKGRVSVQGRKVWVEDDGALSWMEKGS